MLKRLEGDRRRRCRVTGDQPARSGSASREDDGVGTAVRSELLILSKHQQRRKRDKERKSREDQSSKKRKKRSSDNDEVGEDGYLVHSDDEADWSDVGEDIYEPKQKKAGISRKEARRRR